MKNHKYKIIICALIAVLLGFVFWLGGDAPELRGWDAKPVQTASTPDALQTPVPDANTTVSDAPANTVSPSNAPEKTVASKPTASNSEHLNAKEKMDLAAEIAANSPDYAKNISAYSANNGDDSGNPDFEYSADKPAPSNPDNAVITDKQFTCTLTVRCDTILQNISWLVPEKVSLVPENGVIFAQMPVTFYEGESVFNLLLREMKKNKIHMEFENTPLYRSVCVKGINNLYEFDCGELSGWMYRVNGWYPNYGSSRYTLKEGDQVEWIYTCSLGADIGGFYAPKGGAQ